MTCVKTGAQGQLPDGRWIYGDMHQFGDTFVFRVSGVDVQPNVPMLHYTIETWEVWFDEHRPGAEVSTLICRHHQLVNHGYEGVRIITKDSNDGE